MRKAFSITIHSGFFTALCLLLGITLVLSTLTSCGEDAADILDQIPLYSVELAAIYGPENYTFPGQKFFGVMVYCKNPDDLPDNPVYVWQISQEGQLIETVVHDSGKYDKDMPDTTWPKGDRLEHTFNTEGTYIIKAELYDGDDYQAKKSAADAQGSYTHTVHCESPRFTITATPTLNSREYDFKAVVVNRKAIPGSYPLLTGKWQFIDQRFNFNDTGKTVVLSDEFDLADGNHEITHQFLSTGTFQVIFTLEYANDEIGRSEFQLEITSSFRIMLPEGPLETGQEYTFTARTDDPGSLPEDVYYTWDFGDGPVLEIPGNNQVTHLFSTPGSYAIHLGVFEPGEAADMPIGSAVATLEVEVPEKPVENYLDLIHQMKKFHFAFTVSATFKDGSIFRDSFSPQIKDIDVVWNGVDFSMEWDRYGHKGRVTGRVSADGLVIEQLRIRNDFSASNGENQWTEIEIADLPFWSPPQPTHFAVDIFKEDVGNYVVQYSNYRTATYKWDENSFLQIRFTLK